MEFVIDYLFENLNIDGEQNNRWIDGLDRLFVYCRGAHSKTTKLPLEFHNFFSLFFHSFLSRSSQFFELIFSHFARLNSSNRQCQIAIKTIFHSNGPFFSIEIFFICFILYYFVFRFISFKFYLIRVMANALVFS